MSKLNNFKDSPFDKFNNTAEPTPTRQEKPKKVGRPKTKQGEYKTINISIPVELLEKLDTVKQCYQNNLTLYINKLIEKDLDENYTQYKKIIKNLEMFNN